MLAVAGTHGKTTTSGMLAWILEHAGLKPGFLIGGVPENFGVSARLGDAPFFVIEADEYDTAFFDKRSKFVHYRPRTAILNNLEFDHADIFPDLAAVSLPVSSFRPHRAGIGPAGGERRGTKTCPICWSRAAGPPVERFGSDDGWQAVPRQPDASRFQVLFRKQEQGEVSWELLGSHNMANALAAIAAARHAGVPVKTAVAALAKFRNVKRRLEVRGAVRGITVYDDFAHHPTAIAATLEALRATGRRRAHSGGAGTALQHHAHGGAP